MNNKCIINNGWCIGCGKSESAASTCFFDDPFWHPNLTKTKSIKKSSKPPVKHIHNNIKKRAKDFVPNQSKPITIDNFFIRTYGEFEELNHIPSGFTRFFKSKGSEYFTNEDKTVIIRVSDHWGEKIRFCSWHLNGYKKIDCGKWTGVYGKEKRIGKIIISNFIVNNEHKR